MKTYVPGVGDPINPEPECKRSKMRGDGKPGGHERGRGSHGEVD